MYAAGFVCAKRLVFDLLLLQQTNAHSCRGGEGPHDCGDYNSPAWDTAFFVSSGGSWNTDYGHFFLSWYSGLLLQHADRVLAAASEALSRPGRAKRVTKVLKVSFLACCQKQIELGNIICGPQPAMLTSVDADSCDASTSAVVHMFHFSEVQQDLTNLVSDAAWQV